MSQTEYDKVIARPCKGLVIKATLYDGQVWRAWLRVEKTDAVIAEAIGDKSVAEMQADPKAWTRKKLGRRIDAIHKHKYKLNDQLDELTDEEDVLSRFKAIMR